MIALLAPPRRRLSVGMSGRCCDGLVGWLTTKISTTGFVVVLKGQRVLHKRPLSYDVHLISRFFCRLSTLCTYRIEFAQTRCHCMLRTPSQPSHVNVIGAPPIIFHIIQSNDIQHVPRDLNVVTLLFFRYVVRATTTREKKEKDARCFTSHRG